MKIIESTAIVLDIDNIDTDQIIPAKFLKSTERIGFGKHLFDSWRYEKNGSDNPQFPLNTAVKGSEILIAGNNFGCGSSREHAAWALADFGVKVVISSQFADIFKGNALNNGILPVEVSENCLRILKKYFSKNKNVSMKVDLAQQEVRVERDDISVYVAFDVDPLKKKFLMEGTNELDYLIEQREKIAAFEEQFIG